MINWTNCLRTRPWVREQWAREHGLEGVDGPEFDRHLDAVLERISANDSLQRPERAAAAAAGGRRGARLELRDDRAQRRPRRATRPSSAGYLGFGDQSGSKRSADRTWLADAQEHGARLPRLHPRRARARRGRPRGRGRGASGSRPDDGAGARSRCARRGSSSPAARSSRRRCCCARGSAAPRSASTCGCTRARRRSARLRRRPERPGGAPPQAGLCDEFADTEDGYGFLIETAQYAPGLIGSATPWISGQRPQGADGGVPLHGATFIA